LGRQFPRIFVSKLLPTTISRYQIVGRLGQGGMGVVYRGRDPRIGRDVAIKLLHVDNEQLRERFLQEARSAGNLTHRNIVTIYDYGEHEGQPFIAMQFIDGVTLAERMRSGGIATATALRWMQELADGLGYAHDKGVVHRDIKPANVMIDRESVVRILDFGIARVEDSSLTMAGATLGTPSYMSPEQIEGRPVNRRADVFSLGVVMYEVLSGRPPFRGDTAHQIMNAVMNERPPALVSLRPELDPAIDAVVAKAMAKDPEARYQRLSKLSADLAPIRARMPEPAVQDDDQPTGARLEHDEGHRRQQMDAYLDAADRALAQGDLAEARQQLDAALRLDPENSDVLLTQQRLNTSVFETVPVASVPPSGRIPSEASPSSRAQRLKPLCRPKRPKHARQRRCETCRR
jgi:eukaryotic-like serine/threonine-protein kinase